MEEPKSKKDVNQVKRDYMQEPKFLGKLKGKIAKTNDKLEMLFKAANEKRLKQKQESEDRNKRKILVPADLPNRLRGVQGKDGCKINK